MSRSGGGRDAAATEDLYCELDGVTVTLQGEDLTTAGFFIETASPHPMDRELSIYLRSTVGELSARGQIVQVVDARRARTENRRPGFGLLFISLEDDQRAFVGLTLDALSRARARQKAAAPPSVRPAKAPVPRPAKPENVIALKTIAAELRAELTKVQGKTAWTALGLEPDAPLDTAKDAFLRASKRFHPHKFARHDSVEINRLATEVFIAYKRAYDVLTKLAPRTSSTHVHEGARAAQRTITSIAPAASSSSLRPAGGRPRSR